MEGLRKEEEHEENKEDEEMEGKKDEKKRRTEGKLKCKETGMKKRGN